MPMPDHTRERDSEPRIGRSVSIDRAARLSSVSRRTIYNRIREGRLRTVRTPGGSPRVTLESAFGRCARPPASLPDRSRKKFWDAAATVLAVLILLAVAIQPAGAQRRARISQDLADHLAAGSQAIDVIVEGAPEKVAALARKYNLPIRKAMRSGAVLRMNASQLAVVQNDEGLDHLSGDARIQSQSIGDVNAESIGADRVARCTARLQ